MDEAIAFLEEFAQKEYDARQALGGDWAVFQELMQAVGKMCASLNINLTRPAELTPGNKQIIDSNRQFLAKRKVLVVQHHEHPEQGNIYRAILSGYETTTNNDFDGLYWVQEFPFGLRVITIYRLCLDCQGTGKVKGNECRVCRGVGWKPRWVFTWSTSVG
jgi:hypothetical protein